jgi:hypothetical protein
MSGKWGAVELATHTHTHTHTRALLTCTYVNIHPPLTYPHLRTQLYVRALEGNPQHDPSPFPSACSCWCLRRRRKWWWWRRRTIAGVMCVREREREREGERERGREGGGRESTLRQSCHHDPQADYATDPPGPGRTRTSPYSAFQVTRRASDHDGPANGPGSESAGGSTEGTQACLSTSH